MKLLVTITISLLENKINLLVLSVAKKLDVIYNHWKLVVYIRNRKCSKMLQYFFLSVIDKSYLAMIFQNRMCPTIVFRNLNRIEHNIFTHYWCDGIRKRFADVPIGCRLEKFLGFSKFLARAANQYVWRS